MRKHSLSGISKTVAPAGAFATALAISIPAANANANAVPDPGRAIERVTGTGDLAANLESDATNAAVAKQAEGGTALVPHDARQGVKITSKRGSLSIGLPASGRADKTTAGTIYYRGSQRGFNTAVQATADSAVRALVSIDAATAPRSYRFPLRLPTAARLASGDNGSIAILQGNGEAMGYIAAPWAKDAKGNAVPTRYRIEGTTVVQEVRFDRHTTFPVVADPKIPTAKVSTSSSAKARVRPSPTGEGARARAH